MCATLCESPIHSGLTTDLRTSGNIFFLHDKPLALVIPKKTWQARCIAMVPPPLASGGRASNLALPMLRSPTKLL